MKMANHPFNREHPKTVETESYFVDSLKALTMPEAAC